MLAAFKVVDARVHTVASLDSEDQDLEIRLLNDDVIPDAEPADEAEDDVSPSQISPSLPEMVQLERNGCSSHLVQRGIITAIKESSHVQDLIQKVNSIVNFFHVCPRYYDKLKKTNGNLALLRPVVTRWNSQYHSLKRILEHGERKVIIKFLSPD